MGFAPHGGVVNSASASPETSVRETPWAQHALLHTVFFLMGAELFLLSPLLGAIAERFRASDSTTAWVVTSYVLTYAVSSPLLGAVVDRYRRRTVILTGVGVFLVGDLLCALVPSLLLLVLAHAVTGIGGALAAPAIWAYLTETAAPAQRGRAVARGAAMYAGGQILGVPLGTLLAAGLGWRWAFVGIVGGLALSAGLIAGRLREPSARDRDTPSPRSAIAASFVLWRQPSFGLSLGATAFAQAARLGAYTYLGVLYTSRFGFSTTLLGLIGGLVGVGSLIGSMLAGPIVDWWRAHGRNEPILCVGWGIVLAIGLAVALTADSPVLSLVAVIIWFAAGGAFYSTAQAFLVDAVPDQRAAAVSWNNAAMNAGVAAGTAILGAAAATGHVFPLLAVVLALVGSGLGGVLALRARARHRISRG